VLFLLDLIVKGHNNRCHTFSLGHKLTTKLIQVVSGAVFIGFIGFIGCHTNKSVLTKKQHFFCFKAQK